MSRLKTLTTLGAASALAALMATTAGAATLDLIGTPTGTYTLAAPGVYPDGYDLPAPPIGTVVSYFSNADKNGDNGLKLTGKANVTYTYIGSEAGFDNYATYINGDLFYNHGGDNVTKTVLATSGFLDFGFKSLGNGGHSIENDGGASYIGAPAFNIGYAQVDGSWYVFFDDNAEHVDYDDLVMRIDVATVPVPAAGFLLLGGLGALGALSRRRKAA